MPKASFRGLLLAARFQHFGDFEIAIEAADLFVMGKGKHDAAFEAFAAEAGQLEAIRSFDHIPQSLLHGTDGVGVVDMIGIKREAVKYVASADQNAVDDQMKAALDHFATLEYPSDEDVHQLSKEVQEYDARVRQPLLNGFESAVAATV